MPAIAGRPTGTEKSQALLQDRISDCQCGVFRKPELTIGSGAIDSSIVRQHHFFRQIRKHPGGDSLRAANTNGNRTASNVWARDEAQRRAPHPKFERLASSLRRLACVTLPAGASQPRCRSDVGKRTKGSRRETSSSRMVKPFCPQLGIARYPIPRHAQRRRSPDFNLWRQPEPEHPSSNAAPHLTGAESSGGDNHGSFQWHTRRRRPAGNGAC